MREEYTKLYYQIIKDAQKTITDEKMEPNSFQRIELERLIKLSIIECSRGYIEVLKTKENLYEETNVPKFIDFFDQETENRVFKLIFNNDEEEYTMNFEEICQYINVDELDKITKKEIKKYLKRPATEDEKKIAAFEEERAKQQEEIAKLQYESTHDKLTGCLNRAAFDKDIEALSEYTLIAFDVNNLKYTNDTFGHEKGDLLLNTIVDQLKKKYKNVYRMGGDEFNVLLPNIDKDTSILSFLDATFKDLTEKSEDIIYEVAYGVAYSLEGTIDEVKKLADERMYENKKAKKLASKRNISSIDNLIMQNINNVANENNDNVITEVKQKDLEKETIVENIDVEKITVKDTVDESLTETKDSSELEVNENKKETDEITEPVIETDDSSLVSEEITKEDVKIDIPSVNIIEHDSPVIDYEKELTKQQEELQQKQKTETQEKNESVETPTVIDDKQENVNVISNNDCDLNEQEEKYMNTFFYDQYLMEMGDKKIRINIYPLEYLDNDPIATNICVALKTSEGKYRGFISSTENSSGKSLKVIIEGVKFMIKGTWKNGKFITYLRPLENCNIKIQPVRQVRPDKQTKYSHCYFEYKGTKIRIFPADFKNDEKTGIAGCILYSEDEKNIFLPNQSHEIPFSKQTNETMLTYWIGNDKNTKLVWKEP